MNLLAIDTSTSKASVAIHADGEFFSEEQHQIRDHSKILLMVSRLLNKANLKSSDLQGMIFGRGPGSFTGLRMACGVSIGLAYAHHLPLFPVSTLAAIAMGARDFAEVPVLAILDARMNQVYWANFTGDSFSVIERVSDACDVVLTSNKPLCLAGVGFEGYVSSLPEDLQHLKQYTIYPEALAMIQLVLRGHISAIDVKDAGPNYIRNQVTQSKGESIG